MARPTSLGLPFLDGLFKVDRDRKALLRVFDRRLWDLLEAQLNLRKHDYGNKVHRNVDRALSGPGQHSTSKKTARGYVHLHSSRTPVAPMSCPS